LCAQKALGELLGKELPADAREHLATTLSTIASIMDADGDGSITESEFLTSGRLFLVMANGDSPFDNPDLFFEILDADKSGTVTLSELSRLFSAIVPPGAAGAQCTGGALVRRPAPRVQCMCARVTRLSPPPRPTPLSPRHAQAPTRPPSPPSLTRSWPRATALVRALLLLPLVRCCQRFSMQRAVTAAPTLLPPPSLTARPRLLDARGDARHGCQAPRDVR
jgi:hypothetical protein